MKIRLFDYHIQARDHGEDKPLLIDETIDAAIKQGLKAICLTDHFPMPPFIYDPTGDVRVEYSSYAQKVLAAKNNYRWKIEVLLGAEFDWFDAAKEWTGEQIKKYPFDYIIGSVHFLPLDKDEIFCIDYSKKEFEQGLKYYGNKKNLIVTYYKEVQKMVMSGLFDSVGHIDRVKLYSRKLFSEDDVWYRRLVLSTLDLLKEKDQVMEVNTSGWDTECKELFPSTWILQEAARRKIELTLGSDAHEPKEIGRYFEDTLKLLKNIGYESLTRFVKRKKVEVKI